MDPRFLPHLRVPTAQGSEIHHRPSSNLQHYPTTHVTRHSAQYILKNSRQYREHTVERSGSCVLAGASIRSAITSTYRHPLDSRLRATRRHISSPTPAKTRTHCVSVILKRLIMVTKIRTDNLTDDELLEECKRNV